VCIETRRHNNALRTLYHWKERRKKYYLHFQSCGRGRYVINVVWNLRQTTRTRCRSTNHTRWEHCTEFRCLKANTVTSLVISGANLEPFEKSVFQRLPFWNLYVDFLPSEHRPIMWCSLFGMRWNARQPSSSSNSSAPYKFPYVPDNLSQAANVCCDILNRILRTDKNYDF
jgi:hypothetical protein